MITRDFDPRIQTEPAAQTRVGAKPGVDPRALYFGPPNGQSFGWLHGAPDGAQAPALAVVQCTTLGRREVSSHRTMRHLAMDLAEAGIPVLRFDYPGTGDSSTPAGGTGGNGDLAHPGAWVASIGDAIDALKKACEVTKVCVIGLDVGVILDGEALRNRTDVAGIVALAPAVKGRAWLREQRAFGMRAAQAEGPSGAAGLESGSHAFSEQAVVELGRMDLTAIATPLAAEILVLERDDRPGSASAWVQHLRTLGAQVDCRPFVGYDGLMAPTYESVLPAQAIRDTVDWIRVRAAQQERDAARRQSPPSRATEADDVLQLAAGQAGELTITEKSCMVDSAIGLQGILTLPPRRPGHFAPTRAVVLLPAGADRRIGQGRMYVSLARQLAANGLVVLRLDISGVGDSPARPGCQEDVVYSPEAVRDVDTAVRYVRDVLGIADIGLVGYCSGSYNALKAAVAQTPVSALVLINQLVFFWKPGMSLNSNSSEALMAYAARNYRRHFLQASRWLDVLRNPHKIAYAAKVLWRRPVTIIQHGLRDVGRRLGLPLKDDLGRDLLELADRKTRLHFIFASGDPGEALLRASAGSVVKRLIRAGTLQIEHIDGADHEFTQLEHRQQLEQMLFKVLAGSPAPAVALNASAFKAPLDALSALPPQER